MTKMQLMLRILLATTVVAVVAVFGAAHWAMSNFGTVSYPPCERFLEGSSGRDLALRQRLVRVDAAGFDHNGTAIVQHACVGAHATDVTVALDSRAGMLRLTSTDPSIRALAGSGKAPSTSNRMMISSPLDVTWLAQTVDAIDFTKSLPLAAIGGGGDHAQFFDLPHPVDTTTSAPKGTYQVSISVDPSDVNGNASVEIARLTK